MGIPADQDSESQVRTYIEAFLRRLVGEMAFMPFGHISTKSAPNQ